MKKLLLVIATGLITFGVFAQTDSTERKWNQTEKDDFSYSEYQNHPDGFVFQNGKMLKIKDGNISQLEEDATLTNGTVIMSNGIYAIKEGTKMRFKEGEHMDMSGKMVQTIDSRNIDGHLKPKNYEGILQRSDSTKPNPSYIRSLPNN
ncbi:MAG: hypothetical protein JJU28_11995 [Cyclobacteriaceae bacterium]|nr:hypothetical protein [Cyclobacteriaceae bacterium]